MKTNEQTKEQTKEQNSFCTTGIRINRIHSRLFVMDWIYFKDGVWIVAITIASSFPRKWPTKQGLYKSPNMTVATCEAESAYPSRATETTLRFWWVRVYQTLFFCVVFCTCLHVGLFCLSQGVFRSISTYEFECCFRIFRLDLSFVKS